MIEIRDVHAQLEDGTEILKGISLTVGKGEIHAIMGPNGAGKSTLAKIVAGHPDYEVTKGDILVDGESILELEPHERARLGIFMSFQYPVEIPGVSNETFLRSALNAQRKARGEAPLSEPDFATLMEEKMETMNIPSRFQHRSVNEGFSGGEKKRNEILQLAVLNPRISILDETDSGLDIDAMRIVAAGVNTYMDDSKSILLVTHYQRLLDYIKPDRIHVMVDGRIVRSGGPELALELEDKGYDHLQAAQ